MDLINRKKICDKLEQHTCKVHGSHPKAFVEGKSINITACCEEFHQELEGIMDIEVGKQLDKSIDDVLDELI